MLLKSASSSRQSTWLGFALKGRDFSRAASYANRSWALAPEGICLEQPHSLGGFYETAGIVKVFVFAFAFVFSLVAFLQLLLRLPFVRVLRIHLGLLYALDMSCCELGA
jgi:hypothetical protein